MTVIKKGDKPYIYYAKCEECGSIISFMKSELGWSHEIYCPVCKSTIRVDTCSHGDDPYLGNEEVKKEVEEYLANEEKTRAPNRKPAYVPNKKEEITIKVDPDNIDGIISTIKSGNEYESVIEKLLLEVKAISDKVTFLTEGQEKNKVTSVKIAPYEDTKTGDWIGSNPYNVSVTPL